MNNKDIIKHIKENYSEIENIKAVVEKDFKANKFNVCVLGSIKGNGLVCARKTFLEINFNTEYSANKLKDLINLEFEEVV